MCKVDHVAASPGGPVAVLDGAWTAGKKNLEEAVPELSAGGGVNKRIAA